MIISEALLVVPVGAGLVAVEGEWLGDASFAEGGMDDVLLFGWDGSFAASAVEVGVAPEACSEYGHEGVILLGVHVGLEVGEAEGVVDGF